MTISRKIDETDYKILTILQEKARVPNAEIARQVGMAPSAVLERIRKLEERGIIEGYEVRLNPDLFDQGLSAFVQVRIKSGFDPDLPATLAAISGVQDVYLIAGDDGYLLKIRAADPAALGRILVQELGAVDAVMQTTTHIVMNTIKETRKINLDQPD